MCSRTWSARATSIGSARVASLSCRELAGMEELRSGQRVGAYLLRRAPAVAATNAARTGSHFGDIPSRGPREGRTSEEHLGPRPSAHPQPPVGASEDELVNQSACQRRMVRSGTSPGDGPIEDLPVSPDGARVPHDGLWRRPRGSCRRKLFGASTVRRSGKTAGPTCPCRWRHRRRCRTGRSF